MEETTDTDINLSGMWEQHNLDIPAHDGLLAVLSKFYTDIYQFPRRGRFSISAARIPRPSASMARGCNPRDITFGLHVSIARRTATMLTRVGLNPPLLFAGGRANNPCVVHLLGELLGLPPCCPSNPIWSAHMARRSTPAANPSLPASPPNPLLVVGKNRRMAYHVSLFVPPPDCGGKKIVQHTKTS